MLPSKLVIQYDIEGEGSKQRKQLWEIPEIIFKETIKTLYEMQPKIFTSLNLEQKKVLVGLLNILIQSNQKSSLPDFLSTIIELTPNELEELRGLLN